MNTILKSNDNLELSNIKLHGVSLPLPPKGDLNSAKHSHEYAMKMEIYARFMRHLRMVPSQRSEIKVLSAIQFTADMLDLRDELVTKILVDCGLRAPRAAFPEEYLEHVDRALSRSGWEVGGPTKASIDLKHYWDRFEHSEDVIRHEILPERQSHFDKANI